MSENENFLHSTDSFLQRTIISRLLQSEGIFIFDGVYFWFGNFLNAVRYLPEKAFFFKLNNKFNELTKTNKKSDKIGFKYVLCSALAGMITLGLTYSLDYAYISLANDTKNQFNGILDVYAKTIVSKGIAGLYHGFLFSCASMTIFRICFFLLCNFSFSVVQKNQALGAIFMILPVGPILLFVISGVTTAITQPLITIQRHMIMTSLSAIESYGEIVKNGGWLALMNGVASTVFKTIFGQLILSGVSIVRSISRPKQRNM